MAAAGTASQIFKQYIEHCEGGQLADKVFAAMTIAQVERERVDAYVPRPIFDRYAFKDKNGVSLLGQNQILPLFRDLKIAEIAVASPCAWAASTNQTPPSSRPAPCKASVSAPALVVACHFHRHGWFGAA